MKIKNINLDKESMLVSLLLMNDRFCSEIVPMLDENILQSQYAKIVTSWVKLYYKDYNTAPKSNIYSLYQDNSININNDSLKESIKQFIDTTISNYEPKQYTNLPYYIAKCSDYIKSLSLSHLCKKVDSLNSQGKYAQAERLVAQYKQATTISNKSIDLIADSEDVLNIITEAKKPLFQQDGAVGQVVGGCYRQGFLAGLSAMKGTKSWFLMDIDISALRAGLNVAHIDLEMTASDPLNRLVRGILWQPLKPSTVKIPKFVTYDAEPNENSIYHIEYDLVEKKGIPTNAAALRQALNNNISGTLKFKSMASESTKVSDIEVLLDNWEKYDGFVPDVLTVDYCDLLGSLQKDYRQQLNDVWKNLRRVAQERNIFIATVSQSTRAGVDGKELMKSDISEDIRKLAHVTTFVALYGTEDQRNAGYCMLKCMDTRGKRETYDKAVVAQCLDIGRWCVDSRLANNFEGV